MIQTSHPTSVKLWISCASTLRENASTDSSQLLQKLPLSTIESWSVSLNSLSIPKLTSNLSRATSRRLVHQLPGSQLDFQPLTVHLSAVQTSKAAKLMKNWNHQQLVSRLQIRPNNEVRTSSRLWPMLTRRISFTMSFVSPQTTSDRSSKMALASHQATSLSCSSSSLHLRSRTNLDHSVAYWQRSSASLKSSIKSS